MNQNPRAGVPGVVHCRGLIQQVSGVAPWLEDPGLRSLDQQAVVHDDMKLVALRRVSMEET